MQTVTPENKLRLLMIYAALHPEKLEGDKIKKLMEVNLFISLLGAYSKLIYLPTYKRVVVK